MKNTEKPEYDFLVNTGMYVLEPSVLQYIPENTFFNLTDLINKLLSTKAKVGVYPISAKSYLDIGQWKDYQDSIKTLNL